MIKDSLVKLISDELVDKFYPVVIGNPDERFKNARECAVEWVEQIIKFYEKEDVRRKFLKDVLGYLKNKNYGKRKKI